MGDNHIRRKHWTLLCSPRNVHECDLPPDAQTGADQVRYQLDQRIQVFLLLCRQSVNEQVVFSVPVDLPDLGGDLGHAAQHALYRGPEPRDLTAEHNLHSEQHNLHLGHLVELAMSQLISVVTWDFSSSRFPLTES